MNREAIALPSLKKDSKLPVILNRQELKELFAAPTLLKQRIVLTLIYSAGLRGQEVINLKISDIDFERKTIHIRRYGIYNHTVKRNPGIRFRVGYVILLRISDHRTFL